MIIDIYGFIKRRFLQHMNGLKSMWVQYGDTLKGKILT